jgi:hypothetical protein
VRASPFARAAAWLWDRDELKEITMGYVINRKGGFQKQCITKTAKRRKGYAAEVGLEAAASPPRNDLAPELTIVDRQWAS